MSDERDKDIRMEPQMDFEGAPLGADSAVGAGDPNRTAMRPPAEEPSASRKSVRLLDGRS